MIRKFELRITDSDGEQQKYRVLARDAYLVARKAKTIATQYGHQPELAIEVAVDRLINDADMTGALTIDAHGSIVWGRVDNDA